MQIAISNTQTMTSREIAKLTLSTHDSVLKTIRRYIEQGVVSPNETPYVHPQNGQTYTEFQLGFRDAMFVASGYSPNLRARIIDRWIELEAGAAPKLPQTMAQALRLAAEQAELLEQQALQLEAAKPALDFVEKYVSREALQNATQVAQTFGLSAVAMNKSLDAIGGIYSKGVKRGRVFCHDWIEAGYGEVKQTEQGYPQPLFTTKGAKRVHELLTSEGVV